MLFGCAEGKGLNSLALSIMIMFYLGFYRLHQASAYSLTFCIYLSTKRKELA